MMINFLYRNRWSMCIAVALATCAGLLKLHGTQTSAGNEGVDFVLGLTIVVVGLAILALAILTDSGWSMVLAFLWVCSLGVLFDHPFLALAVAVGLGVIVKIFMMTSDSKDRRTKEE